MSTPVEAGQPEEGHRSGTLRKVAAGVLVCAVALALGIGYLVSGQPGTDATANGTPTPAAPSSPQGIEPTTEAATEQSAEPTPPAAATKVEPTTDPGPEPDQAAEAPATPTAPASAPATATAPPTAPATATVEDGTAEEDEPAATDAELATLEQPVSEPVDLEEPTVVTEGISARISTMEAIEAEAFGIGEIAGPALRFVITVENTTDDPVSLSNSVVNVEFGPESLPAVQLTGSGATGFPATVDAGGSASATLVFTVPADQRDQVRILLNLEASSPIAAFEGAAPGEEG
ncbi:hypothetical protein ACX80O_14680 [Arthrobacter sp. Hz1]